MQPQRPSLDDPRTLAALAHPVRLDLLGVLMSDGPATASQAARAIGDSPSNCSYHLRTLAAVGLVEQDESADGRERPWRATITGFDVDAGGAEASALLGASVQADYRNARDYLEHRDEVSEQWRSLDPHSHYGLRVTPDELSGLLAQVDALVRPYIAAVRDDAPDGAVTVNLSLLALPVRRRIDS